MSTIAETTQDIGGGYRAFMQGDTDRPIFRLQAAPGGGYFLEEALGTGRFWRPRSYALSGDGLDADNVPPGVWDDRTELAAQQNEAMRAVEGAGADYRPGGDLQGLIGHESPDVRKAARQLISLQYLLVWPEQAVEEHIAAFRATWEQERSE